MPESIFNKVTGLQLYWKEALAQVFCCEYCEISKSAFYGTPPIAASVITTLTDVKSDTITIQDRSTDISNKNSNPEDIAKAIGSLELPRFAKKKFFYQ